jgi:sulfate adenylyltransferase subunit 2
LDVWAYIQREKIALPSIYFAHDRELILRDGRLLNNTPVIEKDDQDQIVSRRVRFRTVGDMTCTAAVESNASTLDEVIAEISISRISERGETRIDDQQTEAAMEDRKKGGYF